MLLPKIHSPYIITYSKIQILFTSDYFRDSIWVVYLQGKLGQTSCMGLWGVTLWENHRKKGLWAYIIIFWEGSETLSFLSLPINYEKIGKIENPIKSQWFIGIDWVPNLFTQHIKWNICGNLPNLIKPQS